mmetsp:Transcript_26543/g.63320  ORF Transcript_26543/g.63320 Transcript_26543/m.63320 type:complete len:231 (+) Transcript_26543:283-975(+)
MRRQSRRPEASKSSPVAERVVTVAPVLAPVAAGTAPVAPTADSRSQQTRQPAASAQASVAVAVRAVPVPVDNVATPGGIAHTFAAPGSILQPEPELCSPRTGPEGPLPEVPPPRVLRSRPDGTSLPLRPSEFANGHGPPMQCPPLFRHCCRPQTEKTRAFQSSPTSRKAAGLLVAPPQPPVSQHTFPLQPAAALRPSGPPMPAHAAPRAALPQALRELPLAPPAQVGERC